MTERTLWIATFVVTVVVVVVFGAAPLVVFGDARCLVVRCVVVPK